MQDSPDRENQTTTTAPELDLVLRQFNSTSAEYPRDRLIHELFEAQVNRSPDAIAVVLEDRCVTYRDLNSHANRVARELLARGLRTEELVGVYAERSVETIVGMLAVLKAGGAYVPLDPTYPFDRLEFMCNDGSLAAILTTTSLRSSSVNLTLPHIVIEESATAQLHENPMIAGLHSRNLAYVIYTSGSSGRPKGTMIEHRSVVRLVVNASYAEIRSDDCIVHCASPSFDAATWEVWGALLNGARLLVVPQRVLLSPALFGEMLIRNGATAMFLTAALFHQYVDELEQAFGGLRHLLVGGDVVVPSIAVRALAKPSPPQRLLNAYGPTETTTFATTFVITNEAGAGNALPIGRPITNTQAYILDAHRSPVPVGIVGEIYIGGSGVARGYLNNPELDAERFVEDRFGTTPGERLYKTGDLGRWRADGNIEFLGRADSQLKIRGFRIEPGEIEQALHSYPRVKQAVVVAREDEPGVKRLAAYVVAEPCEQSNASGVGGALADPLSDPGDIIRELRQWLAQKLPPYMLPSSIVLMDTVPLTANGKVNRRALPEPQWQQWKRQDCTPPRTRVEATLVELWMEMLKQEQIGIDDNFFEFGGDSMMGLELISRAADQLGVHDLSVIAVFEYPTIREMAHFIETQPDEQESSGGIELQNYS